MSGSFDVMHWFDQGSFEYGVQSGPHELRSIHCKRAKQITLQYLDLTYCIKFANRIMRNILWNVPDIESNALRSSNINKEEELKKNTTATVSKILKLIYFFFFGRGGGGDTNIQLPASIHRNNVQELCKAFNQNFPGIYYFICNRDQIRNK